MWGKTELKIVWGGVNQIFNSMYLNFSFRFILFINLEGSWLLPFFLPFLNFERLGLKTLQIPYQLFFFWLQGLKKVLKPLSVGSKQKDILCACKCSRKHGVCFSNMTQLYGTLLASRRTRAYMTSWDEGLQLRVIFGLSKNHLLWKIKIEINSERALMELGKSLPHTLSLTQRAGEGKMRKIYVYAPERGEWPR